MVQVSLARRLWSAGIVDASPTPVLWHIRQSVRPSSVCGVAVGIGAREAGGFGAGVGAGVGAGLGAGVGAGAPPPQAASSGTKTSIVSTTNHAYFFITALPPLIIINPIACSQWG